MKHFTITTDTEAAALRPFRMSHAEAPKIGDIVSPVAGCAVVTHWQNYPEADALTFDQCMAVVRDEVTEEVLMEVGGEDYFPTFAGVRGISYDCGITITQDVSGSINIQSAHGMYSFIPNITATKIKLLAAILRGENI